MAVHQAREGVCTDEARVLRVQLLGWGVEEVMLAKA